LERNRKLGSSGFGMGEDKEDAVDMKVNNRLTPASTTTKNHPQLALYIMSYDL